jgi:hypothetical protein
LPAGTGYEAITDGVAVDPATGVLYASFCGQGCGADIIDAATGNVTGHLTGPLTNPPVLADNPATGTVYAGGETTVTAYNGTTGTATATTNLGTPIGPIALNATAGTLYVPEADANAIVLLDATSLATSGTLPIHLPYNLAADPATSTLAVQLGGLLDLITLHAPAITSDSHATLTAGRPAKVTLTAGGTPPPTFTRHGRLPYGLTLTSNGQLTGTPGRRTGGTYTLTITASNGVTPAATHPFTLTIDQAPLITTPARASFTAGKHRTFTIRASAYPAATITERSAVPPGLKFTTHRGGTATITGTPARSARGRSYQIRITARNHTGYATQTLTIHIAR